MTMAYSLTTVQEPTHGKSGHGFNIYWAQKLRGAMIELGMMHEADGPTYLEDANTTEMDVYGEMETFVIGSGYATDPTIPEYKLSSNDPWWVTVPEIRATLNVYDNFPWYSHLTGPQKLSEHTLDTIYTDVWHKWIAFLRWAERHNGFVVR